METSTAVLQAINALDYALAPYVHKSFVKEIKKKIREWLTFNIKEKIKDNPKWIDEIDFNKCRYTEYIDHDAKSDIERQRKIARDFAIQELNRVISEHVNCETDAQYIYSLACEAVEEETKQAMEALIHNFNTLHSRAGRNGCLNL